MDRLTAEEALAHPYMADYSFPLDEPVSLHPFHIEDEVDDILLMDQSHSHTWERYDASPLKPCSLSPGRRYKVIYLAWSDILLILVSGKNSLLFSLLNKQL